MEFAFPEVSWSSQQASEGWSALQYQAWARGTIFLNSPDDQQVEMYTDGVLEFLIDGQSFFGGDLYSFRRTPTTLRLSPGPHQLDVRLVRDVRVMGGTGDPTISVVLELRMVTDSIVIEQNQILVSDIVSGRLASSLASLPIRNTGRQSITVLSIDATDVY